MDSSLGYLLKRDGEERDGHLKESDFCGPIHRSGDCNYVNCSFAVDHYHCQICGSGAVEASQALHHMRSSPACRRDSQYLNESSLYNALYGGLTAQNSLCSSGYSGYGQLDSFQWHPTVPVDKMAICGPQLSPCFSAPNTSRIAMDPSIISPVKDLVSLPSRSNGTPSESQPWFYNNQSMQVYKYVEQTSVPQINFLLLDPSVEHKESSLSNDLLPYSFSNKPECTSSQRDLKEPFLPFCSQQNLQPVSSDDSASLFTLQMHDESLNSKQADLFSHEQISAPPVCAQECSNKNKDSSCCMLIQSASTAQNTNIASFTQFETGNISDGEHSSSGSESDIIVEDTTDELSGVAESEMSIETIKCSLLEDVGNVTQRVHKATQNFSSLEINVAKPTSVVKTVSAEDNVRCAICNENSHGSVLIQLGSHLPVTSASHSPVLIKLSQLVSLSASDVVNSLGGFLCQRCLGLVDAVDTLESQLESARQNILQIFKLAVKSGGPILSQDVLTLRNVAEEIPAISPDCSKVLSTIQDEVPSTEITVDQEELVKPFPEKESVSLTTEKSVNDDSMGLHRSEDRSYPKSEEDKVKVFCDQCGSGFSTMPELHSHVATHKQADTKFLCEVCGRRFQYRSQKQMDHHLSQHFPLDLFVCEVCNKSFKSNRALREHNKVHSGDRPFPCPNCDRRFAHSSNMRSHFKLCSGDLPYRCNKCKAGFAVSSRLERHIALAHTGLLGFKCTQCNRTFVKLSDYQTHQRVHSTDRTFTCQVCDRSYKSLSNLNHHAKSHRKEKPFNCDICGQGFLRKDTWESHMFSHKNEKPYKCSECSKAFCSKDNLSMHLKRHAGTHKKNKCPICGKVYSQKLSVHMRTHTGSRPYRCQKCDKSFSTGSSLNKHVLLKHKNSQNSL